MPGPIVEILITAIVVIFLILFLILYLHFSVRKNQVIKQLQTQLEQAKAETDSILTQKNTLMEQYNELKQNQEHIRKIAYTDYLTNLPNRIAFTEILGDILLTLRKGEIIAVLDLDLDDFKDINDLLGHIYGDELLIDLAYRLKGVLSENDYLARIGGDEFAVIVQNEPDFSNIVHKVEQIQNIFKSPFVVSSRNYTLSASIGVVLAPKDGTTTQNLIKNVNSAMYTVKSSGKNSYCLFDESINQRLVNKLKLQAELRTAIEENQFVVYYQPIINLKTDAIEGLEALIRWKHPVRGLLTPDVFIPAAEENGMILSIGILVFKMVCTQLVLWDSLGMPAFMIAINVSARQFADHDFIPTIKRIINETGVDPNRLELELTETTALKDINLTIEVFNCLKQLGISLSLDDFGTGYSSFSYLQKLPVKSIKLDKSFLTSVFENKNDQKIIHAIIELAHILNIDVIAEGVETLDQKEFLVANFCDKVQGCYYSQPVPAEDVVKLLEGQR